MNGWRVVERKWGWITRSTLMAVVTVLLATGWAGAGPLTTSKGTPIQHVHKIGPTKPPFEYTQDMQPGDAAYNTYKDFWDEKLDGLQKFEDPITVLGEFTRSYDCHSWTFRKADSQLPDLSQRYHILGESVPSILQDEGYTNITATPASWRVDDVVVFYKQAGGTPVHTGRLSSVGTSFDDPNLRFTSKWAWTHPLVDVSLRDAMKLYGSVVEIWTQRAYHIQLDWDVLGTDVDLHFRPPDGASFVGDAYPNDCAYYNRTPDWGVQGDPSDDPSLDRDCITDCTEENISAAKLTTPGTYKVLVHYFNDHGLGPTTATVKVTQSGTVIFSGSHTMNATGDLWEAFTFTIPTNSKVEAASGSGPVMTVAPPTTLPSFQKQQ